MTTLELILVYLCAAVFGVVVFRSLRLPPMLGYLVVGVVIGPHALALAQSTSAIASLAEFGVVFLMFVIGLEFSLPKLRAMGRHVFGLGLAQVAVTMAVATLGLHLLGRWAPGWWSLDWRSGLALSGALAMSSTAIVGKLMAERLELDSEHGKRVLGVLLFQDLAVVPLLVLVPALGSKEEHLMQALGLAMLKAAGLVVLLLWGGQRIMRWWLTLVARRKSEELFVLNLLLITLGMAWLTEHFGLSLALGAFIAGMLISETEFKAQVESDIRPFHDVLMGLFFISIGMMLDWHLVVQRWGLVLLLVTVPVAFKIVLITGLAKVLGASTGVAVRTGLYLAQAGEFGFVLLSLGSDVGLIPASLLNPILAGMVLSMLMTPFIIAYSDALVLRFVSSEWMQSALQMTAIARRSINVQKHVIICGFGRCGQNLARMLEPEGIDFIALDLDPDRVRQAAAAGDAVVFGDASRPQALIAAGLSRASAVVVTYLDLPGALKVIALVRAHAPHVPVIVRTQDDRELERLYAAGATEVVPEAIEGSLMLASHALALVGVPMRRVIRIVQEQRDRRYSLLRGYFHGTDDSGAEDLAAERLETVVLPPAAAAIGKTLGELALEELGVRLVSWRRSGGRAERPDSEERLVAGDVLVLGGRADALLRAEERLLRG
jgi:CPA2 family monovalent cation:H+ antiporter-2